VYPASGAQIVNAEERRDPRSRSRIIGSPEAADPKSASANKRRGGREGQAGKAGGRQKLGSLKIAAHARAGK
jgi:hypothetical protein